MAALLLALGVLRPRPVRGAPSCEGCNVILVSLDTLRADALGVYGYRKDVSPNIDRLASRGAAFMSAFSQFPQTLPSHMSIFTGQYPWTHRVRIAFQDELSTATLTLPMILKERGYRTVWAAVMADPDLALGAGFSRGFDDFVRPVDPYGDWDSRALAWLDGHAKEKFFMFLHSYKTHDPYLPQNGSEKLRDFENWEQAGREVEAEALMEGPARVFTPRFVAAHAEAFGLGDPEKKRAAVAKLLAGPQSENELFLATFKHWHKAFWSRFDVHAPADVARARSLYDACVHEADAGIGALYRKLEELGIADKTLLVITSDHGEEFMEHGRTVHSQDYVELVHVPLIFAFPKKQIGAKPEGIARSIDIAPTILEALGMPKPAPMQGESLLAMSEGRQGKSPPRTAFAQWFNSYSVRDARYTYLIKNNCDQRARSWNAGCVAQEFYDRAADPGERKNIYAGSARLARKYRERLLAEVQSGKEGAEDPWLDFISAGARKNMLDTGYW